MLSLEQWAVVRSKQNMLVTSVPGAGKTRMLQTKAILEAAALVDGPHSIACLTYTNAAAAELKRRILPSIRDDARDRLYIGTVHSFCVRCVIVPYAGRLPELSNGHRIVTVYDPTAQELIDRIIGREGSADDVRRFENC